ncbi:MAG: serine/threonine kinase PknH [Solirubrobacteraceae bacterium]|nr:serine/threonine kinase PknH [Solirubrobacteraceae bacterium]
MGVVYLAHQSSLSRSVALKVIGSQFGEDSEFEQRFDREARHAASLDHPNVVPVFETGRAEGLLYLAMRYVQGTDLRGLLDDGPLGAEDAVRIIVAVAAALDAAHGQGLIHRDVKPANILLAGDGPDGHVYLGDFGLTKDATSESGGLTLTGQVVGTLDYMAPEQIDGGVIDARIDVYALGCVLFQTLSGRVPYTGTQAQKMFAHATKPPPSLAEVVPELAAAFDPVIARGMAKNPDDRYPSAGDLGRAAQAALRAEAVTTPERSVATGAALSTLARRDAPTRARPIPVAPPRRRRWPVVVGIAALLAVGGVIALVVAGGDDAPPKRADAATPDAEQITTLLRSYYEQPAPDQCGSLVTDHLVTALYSTVAACQDHQVQRAALPAAQRTVTVGNVRVNGTRATATLTAGGFTLPETLVKTDGQWRLDGAGSPSSTPTPTATATPSGPKHFGEPTTFKSPTGVGPATEISVVVLSPVNHGRDRHGARSARIRFTNDFGKRGPARQARFVNLPITVINMGNTPFRGDVSGSATAADGLQFSPLDRRDLAQRNSFVGRLPDWTTGEADGIRPGARVTRYLTFAVPANERLAEYRVLPDVLTGPDTIAQMEPTDGILYRR